MESNEAILNHIGRNYYNNEKAGNCEAWFSCQTEFHVRGLSQL